MEKWYYLFNIVTNFKIFYSFVHLNLALGQRFLLSMTWTLAVNIGHINNVGPYINKYYRYYGVNNISGTSNLSWYRRYTLVLVDIWNHHFTSNVGRKRTSSCVHQLQPKKFRWLWDLLRILAFMQAKRMSWGLTRKAGILNAFIAFSDCVKT